MLEFYMTCAYTRLIYMVYQMLWIHQWNHSALSESPIVFDFYSLYSSTSTMVHEPWGEAYTKMLPVRSELIISYYLHADQMWISLLIVIWLKNKLPLWRLKDALIGGTNNKLGMSSILCPFSHTNRSRLSSKP